MVRWISFLLFSLLLVGCSKKQSFKEGEDYSLIKPPIPIRSSGSQENNSKVSVIDIFWYGCPSCYEFEDKLNKWKIKNSEKIDFSYQPAPFAAWQAHARLFWALSDMGIERDARSAIFKTIHTQKSSLTDPSEMVDFLTTNFAVDANAFSLLYNSKGVMDRMAKTFDMLQKSYIRSVPALIINGKYTVLEKDDQDRMLKIADFLIDKEIKQN